MQTCHVLVCGWQQASACPAQQGRQGGAALPQPLPSCGRPPPHPPVLRRSRRGAGALEPMRLVKPHSSLPVLGSLRESEQWWGKVTCLEGEEGGAERAAAAAAVAAVAAAESCCRCRHGVLTAQHCRLLRAAACSPSACLSLVRGLQDHQVVAGGGQHPLACAGIGGGGRVRGITAAWSSTPRRSPGAAPALQAVLLAWLKEQPKKGA